MSDNTPVYLREINLANYRCFKGDHQFIFAENMNNWYRWTVFLGNNNTGKTNLLKLIASSEPKSFRSYSPDGDDEISYGILLDLLRQNNLEESKLVLSVKNTEYVEDIRCRLSPSTSSLSEFSGWGSLLIYGYGVVRDVETRGISTDSKKKRNASNLFDGSKLINFEDWLFQLDYAAKNGQEKAVYGRDLLKEILTSDIFPEISDIRFISDEDLNNYIEFETKNGWYKLSELGYGYQATLSWVMDFSKKLFDRYPESKNPLKEPAILLIDEIDLHLHPQWQRSLIKYLSNIFPKTQFIVTTHSPFILQSMENVNLYTLRREGDHTNVKHWGNQSFVGWGIEEILREIMELGDDIQTDYYQDLVKKFDKALDNNDYEAAKQVYSEITKILHPESPERKLMEIQLSQISNPDD